VVFSLSWAQGFHVKIAVFFYFPHICLLLFPGSGGKINRVPDLRKFGKNTIHPPSCVLYSKSTGIIHIELVQLPALFDNRGHENSNGSELNYGEKSLKVINPLFLCKPFHNELCFLSFNTSICLMFYLVYPLASNRFFPSR